MPDEFDKWVKGTIRNLQYHKYAIEERAGKTHDYFRYGKYNDREPEPTKKEFAEHARVDRVLKSKGYFAEPFSSWQRGTNENFNGLVRQYIPKKRPLSSVTDTELAIIEDRLNNRPRKRLAFKTPHELFSQSLNRVALRT